MRIRWLPAMLILALALPVFAGEYGAPLSDKTITPIAKIMEDPDGFKGQTVRIEGTIKEMCVHKGCWLVIADADGNTMLAKSTGDKVTVPGDASGKTAIVEGEVIVDYSVKKGHEEHAERDDHAHGEHGEHAGEAHDCKTAKIRLETAGVLVN